MEKQGLWPAVLRLGRNAGIIVLCILVLAGLSCLPAAWRTFYHLGNRVVLLGALVLVLDLFPVVNTWAAGDLEFLMPTGDRFTKQWIADLMVSFRITMTMLIAGSLAALLGYLIRGVGLSVLGIP